MRTVASRDLRNHTAEVLRQVAEGTRVTVTVNGTPVAEISPVSARRPRFFEKADLMHIVQGHQADAGLTGDLERLAGDTTDDLDPLRAHPALLDTSVLIVRESGRALRTELIPDRTAVCVITIAELHLGVPAATDTATRSRLLATVEAVVQ